MSAEEADRQAEEELMNDLNEKTVVMGPTVTPITPGTSIIPFTGRQKEYGSVWVQGTFMNRAIMKMFLQHGGFKEADSYQTADFVVWTGGADINPTMYHEKPIPGTFFNTSLDTEDVKVYSKCYQTAIKIGICRGAQLLNVLNGGKLWQDIDNHNTGDVHEIVDHITGEMLTVNTLHHQQMILPRERGELLAYTKIATRKDSYGAAWLACRSSGKEGELGEVDVEAAWFPDTFCLCYQPHPEFQHQMTRKYFFDLIDRCVFPG